MKTSILILTGLSLLFPITATAQKDDAGAQSFGIFDSQQEYFDFMGAVKSDPEMRELVPMINDIVLERELGWTAQKYGDAGSSLGLLSDDKVRSDLEMLDYQYEELQERNAEIQKEAAQQIRGLDLSDMARVAEEVRKIRARALGQMQAGLLPHQLERLRQIEAQSQLRNRSLIAIITSEPIKTNLLISDEQAEQLQTSEREAEEDLARQIAELRKEARERVLESLDPAQREKVDGLFGETFEFVNPQTDKADAKAEQQRRDRK